MDVLFVGKSSGGEVLQRGRDRMTQHSQPTVIINAASDRPKEITEKTTELATRSQKGYSTSQQYTVDIT